MKKLLLLILMLKVWGHLIDKTIKEDERPQEFEGVILNYNADKTYEVRFTDGHIHTVSKAEIEGSQWVEVKA